MQIFEFHFNPKVKKDLLFESFCFEPENVYEKRLGGLYMAGFLKNVLPKNTRFLDNLAKAIKEKYYKGSSYSSERSLKESLKEANNFLEKIARNGDVSWLGNLNFAVTTLKNLEFNFTKVGDLKIILLRKGGMIDIEKNIKLEGLEPYPLKVFPNLISGKLAENDIILVLTKEVFDAFSKENLFAEIASLSPFEPKTLKQILNKKREQLSKVFGLCLLLVLTKESLLMEKEAFAEEKGISFSFKEAFRPLIKFLRMPKLSLPRFSFKRPVIKRPSFKKPSFKFPRLRFKIPELKLKIPGFLSLRKKLNLILFLFLILSLGWLIFEKTEEKQLKLHQTELNQIQEKVNQAQSYLIVAKNNPQALNDANSLFKESWEKISPLSDISSTFPSDFANQVSTLKETISDNLFQLNKLKMVEEPELIFEFKPREYIPQKIVYFKGSLYFFSPYSENVLKLLDKENKTEILSLNKKISSAQVSGNSVLFFSKPNQLIVFDGNEFKQAFSLQNPYAGFDFKSFGVYQSNLYFLDGKSPKIIKYLYSGDNQWGLPYLWGNLETKNAADLKSLAVDGSVWLLTKENNIEKYYAGFLQQTFKLDVFPYPKELSKISTFPLSPFYVLEPVQKRILIFNKSAEIIQQYQSEKFDNLLDFTVSEDGKTIYLLNGLKVYQIKL